MIQPKYSPQEALERVKLMMNYDSSKTLTENKQLVMEIEPITVGLVIAGLSALGVISAEWTSKDSKEKMRLTSKICEKNNSETKRKTMNSTDWSEVAGKLRKSFSYSFLGSGLGTDLEALREALSLLRQKGNFGDYCEVRKLFLPNSLEEEFISELNTSELFEVVSTLEYLIAKSGQGNVPTRNEETANSTWWLDTFPCLEHTRSLKPGFQIFTDGYGNSLVPVQFKVKGTVKDFWIDQNGRVLIGTDHTNTQQTGKYVVCSGRKVTLINESITKKNLIKEQAEFNFDINPAPDEPNGGENDGGKTGGGKTGGGKTGGDNRKEVYPLEAGSYWTTGDPYQYRVRDGQWETKSWKSAKIIIDNWKSLKDNDTATKELDRRHPGVRQTGSSSTVTTTDSIPPKLSDDFSEGPQTIDNIIQNN